MNAPDPQVKSPAHFQYFPGNYRWSAEMLMALSTTPFGGAQHCQRDYLTLACDTVADWPEDRFKK